MEKKYKLKTKVKKEKLKDVLNLPKYRIVGQSIKRIDAFDKVTGQAKFIADILPRDFYYLKIYRSERPHSKIKLIDKSEALKVDGVIDVITGEVTDLLFGDCIEDHPPIARERVRYVGEPVAVIVATNKESAENALEKVKVEYEDLPAVFDPVEAMRKEAPLIHPDLGKYKHFKTYHPKAGTNIFHHYHLEKGDIEKGFKESKFIIEKEFYFPLYSHCQLEPHGCMALWSLNDELTVWSSTQSPHWVRLHLAEVFKLPIAKVKVIAPYIGGGFGGKSDYTLEPLVATVARVFKGKVVRLVLEREEMFFGTVLGRGCKMKIKIGFDEQKKIKAMKIMLAFQAGAYGNNAINIVEGAGHNATGPYYVENLVVDSYGVYTNTPPVGAFRGYGHPEVHWMIERIMDIAAEYLKIEPYELRMKNLLRPGQKNAFGQVIKKEFGDLEGCFNLVYKKLQERKKENYKKYENSDWYYGIGYSALMKSPVMATNAGSSALMKLNRDSTVNVYVGSTDIGQGSITALTQIAAEILQLPIEKIFMVKNPDTDSVPYEWQTVASSTTWKVGNAIIKAGKDLIKKVKYNLAVGLGCSIDDIIYENGYVYHREYPEKKYELGELALGFVKENGEALGGPVISYGYYVPKGLTYADENTGRGNLAAEWTFGAQGAEVIVHKYTGEIKILYFITALDVGYLINPKLAKEQVIGAVVQGIGASMFEKLYFNDEGRIRNPNFTDYKIPSLEDIPEKIDVYFLTTPGEDNPFGAKPLAEHGIVAVAPSIANAIKDATGIDFYTLPINQDILLCELKKREKQ